MKLMKPLKNKAFSIYDIYRGTIVTFIVARNTDTILYSIYE